MIETVSASPGCKALVVDDEPAIVELVRDCLAAHGYEVDGAETASRALELIRHASYDVVFMDIMLPDMDGIMVHDRLRALDPGLARRTVFMSGWAKTPEIGEYLGSIGRFLPKPFSVDDLLAIALSMN